MPCQCLDEQAHQSFRGQNASIESGIKLDIMQVVTIVPIIQIRVDLSFIPDSRRLAGCLYLGEVKVNGDAIQLDIARYIARAGCLYLGEVKVNGDAEQNFQEFVLLRVKAIEDGAESLRNIKSAPVYFSSWFRFESRALMPAFSCRAPRSFVEIDKPHKFYNTFDTLCHC